MTTVVISQPMYFPWPGFLAQLALADVVVWLVDAQFSRRSFTNRVQIRSPSGSAWLSIPIKHTKNRTDIVDIVAAEPNWLDLHIDKLKKSLSGTPYLDSALAPVLHLNQHDGLCDAIVASSKGLASQFGINPSEYHLSTDLNVTETGSNRILQIVQELGGTRYVTGHGARNYLEHKEFELAGINVEYMEYDVRPWGRVEDDFSPFVTGLDLLAHVGPAQAASYLNPRTRNWKEFLQNHQQT
ncbi:WbqC family protein [Ruegeria sp. SCSIO 43209]|uniref:WbqC family protein n=1 Tax=Ruegeria sp. SCSIO 43209 TaxID=2793010 RepID=UPI001CA7C90C|nr:WbqC family protein [Ruegeria sp. SCSIO 43209]UAB89844.1 WbqC family protein [Ruegeria sp. SCSIO 43209]